MLSKSKYNGLSENKTHDKWISLVDQFAKYLLIIIIITLRKHACMFYFCVFVLRSSNDKNSSKMFLFLALEL